MRGKGEGAVYKDEKRGLWVGTIELPPVNGVRQRKTVRRKRKGDLLDEMARLRVQLKRDGTLSTSSMTVEQWFRFWLKLTAKEARPNTLSNYRTVTEKYVIPSIGKVKLDKLTGTHLRKVYDGMLAHGLSSTYALNAHRIMSASFKIAIREGRLSVNPAMRTAPPRKAKSRLETLDLAEGLEVLAHLATREDGARWAVSLLIGARRGEVIGLERSRVTDELDLSWQLQRIIWSHGCGDQIEVDGRKEWPCSRKRGSDCTSRLLEVPDDYEYRHLTGGLYLTRPKSAAGWRVIPLVDPLKSILERYLASTPENQYGLVFARDGRPYDPDQTSRTWREILAATGIEKDVRLHDIRHTTVELLYAAGVPEDIIAAIVGHSTIAQTRAYRTRSDQERLRAAMEKFSAQFIQPDRELPEKPSEDAA